MNHPIGFTKKVNPERIKLNNKNQTNKKIDSSVYWNCFLLCEFFTFLLCCIKLRLEDLDWKISYVQHNKLSTSKHYYLFLTFCNLEAWFLFTQSKIEDIALFETDITEKITSFITTRIPPFSEISILTVYVVSMQMSLFKFQICLF